MRQRLRQVAASATFLAGAVLMLSVLTLMFVPNDYPYGRSMWNGYRQIEPGALDVLIVGNSHAYTSMAAPQLWSESGISAWVLGGSSINMRTKLAYVEEAMSMNVPRILALEVHKIDQATEVEARNNHWAYDAMPAGLPKVAAIRDTAPAQEFERYIFPLIGHHQGYAELARPQVVSGLGLRPRPQSAGSVSLITPRKNRQPDVAATESALGSGVAGGGVSDLAETGIGHIEQILELCNQHDVEVVLWLAPVESDHRGSDDPMPLLRERFGDRYPNVRYLNMNLVSDDMGITPDDFRDSGHVFAWGMDKATRYMGAFLRREYPRELGGPNSDSARWDAISQQWDPLGASAE